MKLSRYNFLRNYDGVNVFFNAKTCALAVVDDDFMKIYHGVESGTFDPANTTSNLLSQMKASGCLIEDNVDEIKDFESSRNIEKNSRNVLSLVIAPTFDCNLRCFYCFESHTHKFMHKDVQIALIKLVSKKLQQAKRFAVTWFGGEPLVSKPTIYELSQKFMTLCQEHDVSYTASIITNGSLIHESDIINFQKYKIGKVQITVDGPQMIHDKRRPSVDGRSTFDLIISNINLLLDNGISVIVRINIDKDNISYVDDLLSTLSTRIRLKEKLEINFGHVLAFNEASKSAEKFCLSVQEFAELLLSLYEKVISYGFTRNRMDLYPNPRFNFCGVGRINSLVIDPMGNIHKCWNHITEQADVCGTILGDSPRLNTHFDEWINWNPLEFSKCRECNLLPICAGGCPDLGRKSRDKKPVCRYVKYNVEQILKHYYEDYKCSRSSGVK